MKRRFVLCLLILSPLFAVAADQTNAEKTRSGNPIVEGWYADPEGIIFGDRYWIYPTYSAPYGEQTFFDAFSSPDLVNWTKHPSILSTATVKWASRAVWAPSPVYRNGMYYLFFAANDIQNDRELGGIGVGVSKSPAGPFVDAIGKPLIDRFHNGAQPIDPNVFIDDDGQAYLYYGGWKHCNVAKLSIDLLKLEPLADGSLFKEITPDQYVEGPCTIKRNGKYYFMWSEGGWGGPHYSVAYAVAESPFGPFQRIGKILQQDPKVATGAGHHSVIHIPQTDDWYIVYHRRPLSETDANHRATCIDRMIFNSDGTIQPVKITFEGVEKRLLK